jgi:translation initiation factor IF-2
VYELAKELGLQNKDLVSRIQGLGIEVANHMSHLEAADVDRVRRSLTRERQETLVEERLSDTVIRRRSRTTTAAAPVGASAPAPVAARGAGASGRPTEAPRPGARAQENDRPPTVQSPPQPSVVVRARGGGGPATSAAPVAPPVASAPRSGAAEPATRAGSSAAAASTVEASPALRTDAPAARGPETGTGSTREATSSAQAMPAEAAPAGLHEAGTVTRAGAETAASGTDAPRAPGGTEDQAAPSAAPAGSTGAAPSVAAAPAPEPVEARSPVAEAPGSTATASASSAAAPAESRVARPAAAAAAPATGRSVATPPARGPSGQPAAAAPASEASSTSAGVASAGGGAGRSSGPGGAGPSGSSGPQAGFTPSFQARAAAAAAAAPPQVIKQIVQPVVTGSAATGQFIQLPGRTPPGVPKVEIKDRDEELRRLGRAPVGRDRFGRPAGAPGGAPGQRPGQPSPWAPKKRMAASGKKAKKTEITTPAEHKRVVRMGETIQVSDFAQKMGIKGKEIIKRLWALGMMGVNINHDIDHDTATLIANEFGYQIESTAFREDEVLADSQVEDSPEDLVTRAPVVTIMGHVDHGKTSLLDAIRKANVAGGEAGGITQHIGAYKVHSDRGDVVFLDTPGHEAFTAMRARGAMMTDIVVLVVAADDGPMPQTVEAINHAKEAGVPILVAVNKIDKPGANPDLIRNKLAEFQLVPEEWGGETIFVNVSAKTKQGVDKLLEMLALQAEVLELKANPKRAAKGYVVEARLDRSRGPISTLLVEEGTLRIGDIVVAGEFSGKIRAMLNDKGQNITEAGPSTPVELLGVDGVPDAGEIFNVVSDEKASKSLVEHRRDSRKKKETTGPARVSLENILDKIRAGEVKEVKIVLKADVQGSAEAVSSALANLSTPEVRVNVIASGVGGITESDVTLAKASAAIVIGFNVRPAGKSSQMAEQDGVEIKLYQIIYEAIDDVKKAMVGMLAPVLREKVTGRVEVRKVFNIPKAGVIAGSFVTEGKVSRKSQVRLIRDSVVVYTGRVGSLRRFKDDASEVAAGYECGISIDGYSDLREGDIIESFEMESIAATLSTPTSATAAAAPGANKR